MWRATATAALLVADPPTATDCCGSVVSLVRTVTGPLVVTVVSLERPLVVDRAAWCELPLHADAAIASAAAHGTARSVRAARISGVQDATPRRRYCRALWR